MFGLTNGNKRNSESEMYDQLVRKTMYISTGIATQGASLTMFLKPYILKP